MSRPPCPVTGAPAARFVQWVEAPFLVALWKLETGADAALSFRGIDRFGLWQSPTGLYFFDPPTEGDRDFYEAFYSHLLKRKLWHREARRQEFVDASRLIKPGDRVLDVGCGYGGFRHSIPQARYTGLDPHFADQAQSEAVHNELLHQHLERHAAGYDVVCAFQVVEHVNEPVRLFANMVRAARPGGLLIVTVPHIPSAMLRIPNFPMNAPPHHLTWWTRGALAALARQGGAEIVTVERVDWDRHDSLIYWIERCSFIRCKDEFFRRSLGWRCSTLLAYFAGRLMHRIKRRAPADRDEGASLMLVARRPLAS